MRRNFLAVVEAAIYLALFDQVRLFGPSFREAICGKANEENFSGYDDLVIRPGVQCPSFLLRQDRDESSARLRCVCEEVPRRLADSSSQPGLLARHCHET
jgi:hypothetical protein